MPLFKSKTKTLPPLGLYWFVCATYSRSSPFASGSIHDMPRSACGASVEVSAASHPAHRSAAACQPDPSTGSGEGRRSLQESLRWLRWIDASTIPRPGLMQQHLADEWCRSVNFVGVSRPRDKGTSSPDCRRSRPSQPYFPWGLTVPGPNFGSQN